MAGATLLTVTKPAHGRAVMVNGRVEYLSDPNFAGVDTFQYTVKIASGETFTATVTVTVQGESVTNDPQTKLSLTGSESKTMAAIAFALLLCGMALLVISKRRKKDDDSPSM
jgi:LPXTG-motif cell wall-anchored protein